MCLVFRSSSYPCKDVKIHHIQITIAELSCCPVGGVMLLRAPKRRIFSKTGVSPMPHASDYFIINTSRHVRYQSFLFWLCNHVDDPWPMEHPGVQNKARVRLIIWHTLFYDYAFRLFFVAFEASRQTFFSQYQMPETPNPGFFFCMACLPECT